MKVFCLILLLTIFIGTSSANSTCAQGGKHILYGDVKVDESKTSGAKPLSYDLVLYLGSIIVRRQSVSSEGRYRFIDLTNGYYDLAVELEGVEIARMRVEINSPRINTDFRQDIALEWRAPLAAPAKPASVSAADYYQRSSPNQKLFDKAQAATDKRKYEEASALINQILANDPKDFQAWTELGTLNLLQNNLSEAEKAYVRAIEVRPKFFLALLNLGRLRSAQKKFEEAVDPLTLALEIQPTSGNVNLLLGEAYLQIKKGSKAVGYLTEAAKLGQHEAHLRLATLYNAAGMKEKAATEYEQFLKKTPNYPDRKKLEQYIAANKKSQ
jgi:tetratricopeptide (TPR) repeat protein